MDKSLGKPWLFELWKNIDHNESYDNSEVENFAKSQKPLSETYCI